MRVVMLTTSWPRTASDHAGRFLVPLVQELEQAGVEVRVLAPGSGFRDFGLAGGDGVVANARRRPWLLPLLVASMAWSVWRAGRSADVVHAHWLLLAPIAACGRRPLVLTLHGSGSAGRFSDLELARRSPTVFRWLVRRAVVVVGVSEPLAAAARAGGARGAVCIPHGVTIPIPQAARDRTRSVDAPMRLLFAGRLSREKGVAQLASALDGVDGITLTVAGDGPERSLVPDALGFVAHERLLELYDNADALVVPSLSEGFGVVALEAMASGLPVVASNVGGLPDIVEHEHTGLLVEPGDVPALRAALLRLRDEPELRRRLGAAGRARARERFGWPAVTELLVDAYRRAHASRGRPR